MTLRIASVLRDRWLQAVAGTLLLVGAIYCGLLAFWVGPLNAFWSSDQGVKLIQVQSLVLNKYRSSALQYPGMSIDPLQAFSPLRGQYLAYQQQSYAMFSQLFAALSGVPYFLFGYAGLYLLPLLSGVLILAACAPLARRLIDSAALAIVALLVIGVTSPVLFYSLIFWEHTPATLLVLLGVWQAVVAAETGRTRNALLAGLLVGLAAWLRNESVLAVVALGLALLLAGRSLRWRLALWIGAGATVTILPLLLFNQLTYGVFLGPHVVVAGQAAYTSGVDLGAQLAERRDWAALLLVPGDHPWWMAGLLLILVLGLSSRLLPTGRSRLISGWGIVATAGVMAFAMLTTALTSNPTSLLLTFPIALLWALPGMPGPDASGPQTARIVGVFSISFILLAWAAAIPDGGSQWGPRLLLPAIPLLGLLGLRQASNWYAVQRQQIGTIALVVVAAMLVNAAALVELRGLRVLRELNIANYGLLTTVAQSEQQVIITDIWYAPPYVAPIFYDQRMVFLIQNSAELDQLLAQLEQHRQTSFYYLGTQREQIVSGSRAHERLVISQEALNLPHDLSGAIYRIAPR